MTTGLPDTRRYMPCLDGIRGLAALIVVFGHAPAFGFATTIQPHSRDYGVLIFFVLSGFLMGDIYLSQMPTRSTVLGYISSRIARIAPLYFLVVLLSFVIFQTLDPNFTYPVTSTQLLRLLTFNGSVSVFWSIGPEVQFYGLFVLLWLISSRSKTAFFICTICLAAISLLTSKMWSGVFVMSKFHIFACGVLVAAVRRQIKLPPSAVITVHLTSIALLIAISVSEAFSVFLGREDNDPTLFTFYDSLPRTLVAGMIVFSFSYESRLGKIIFANRLMTLLGAISFSVYLLHEAVMYFFVKVGLLRYLGDGLGTATMIIASLIIAVASYKIVEMPARNWIKKLSRKIKLSSPTGAQDSSAPEAVVFMAPVPAYDATSLHPEVYTTD